MDLTAFGVKHTQFSLDNGLRCVVFERPGMPVYVRAAFKAGSRYDTPGKEGLAHYLEHMVVAGTKKFPTKTEMAAYIEQYGGVFGATTPMEEICIDAAVGDPVDLDIAFEVLGEMLTQSIFDPKAIDNEREAVLGEIGNWEANPASKIWELRYQLFFQNTSVGRPGVGLVQAVNAITKADLVDYMARLLTVERGLILVSGGVTAEQVKETANRHLHSLTKGTGSFEDGEVSTKRLKPVLIDKKANDQIQISFGFRTCPLGHADTSALDVIATILGGGRASTLGRILRQEQGLVYTVSARTDHLAAGGYWSVETTAPTQKLQKVLDAVTTELKRVRDGGITPEELAFAKSKTLKSMRMQTQMSSAWVAFHTRHNLHMTDDWTLANYLDDIENVTGEDLAKVGSRYFVNDNWYLGLIGNIEADDFEVKY